jgi:hypothetical protein
MRPVRIVAAVMLTAALAVTGCAAHSTADPPSAAPTSPVVEPAPAPPLDPPAPAPRAPAPAPRAPAPKPPIDRVPVLADGRYDAYIRQVETPRAGATGRLVVDLVQVFHDQAAVDAAIADGQSREAAQYLVTYVRNQNPRLRTLPLSAGVQLQLLGGDCESSVSQKLGELARHARSGIYHYYYDLTVTGGAVQRIVELRTANAC